MEGKVTNTEHIHNSAEAQAVTSASKLSTFAAPSPLTVQVDMPASEAQRSPGYVKEELDKPRALADVIEKLSYEQFPEYVRKNDSTLTFPEKLMLMMIHVERVYAKQAKKLEDQLISWSNNGKSFVIRDKDALCKSWVPAFFGQAKFSSFTRKLYRWGFRKVNVSINDKGEQIVVFSNENFQRDDVSRLSKMQSITAAKVRNQLAVKSGPQQEPNSGNTSVGVSGNVPEKPSIIDQLLRERISSTGSDRLANPSLLQYQQQREQEMLRNRSLLASQLNNARFSPNNLPTMQETSLLGRQQAVLNRYRQSPVALPATIGNGDSSTMGLNLAAMSQLDNLRLLEALDRQRTAGIGSLNNSDGALEQLFLQRHLRAAQAPSVDLTTSMQQPLDAYALIRRGLENNIVGQNIRSASLQQQLENRSSSNVDRQYLAALAAILQQQQNHR